MSVVLDSLRWRAGAFMLEVTAQWHGRITGVFGPSGTGKTTLVEVLAGLRRPEAGTVVVNDTLLDDAARKFHLPPEQRLVGYVPQDGALFPHLDVDANIRYGCPRASTAPIDRLCELLDIQPLRRRRIAGLSGGERQRVAIARALAASPRLLLLDEPLAALDAARKEAILPYLRRLRDETDVPIVYVTHALPEIIALCDELVVMEHGRVLQSGRTEQVLRQPAADRVAHLVGVETIVPARVVTATEELLTLELGGVRLVALPATPLTTGAEVLVSIRAEDVILIRAPDAAASSARNRLTATVHAIVPTGPTVRVELDCGFPLVALLTRQAVAELGLAVGDMVQALVKAPNVHVIPRH